MENIKKIGNFILICLICVLLMKMPVHADNVKIVIDPGHGGKNLGAQWEGRDEKDILLVVAKAMKEELEKYEGITVYMTRDDDMDMSLQERASFANKKNADFLYSLHFNMSEYHTLYGTEIWVSAFGEGYSKGYAFGEIFLDQMTDLGLYSRGVKTRLNKQGTDYYGVIRACTEYEIPSAILEHCYLDRPEDAGRHETEENLKELGRLDATAVAKYFKLSSKELGVDYSDYEVSEIPIPQSPVKPDLTPPDKCELEILSVDEEKAELTFRLSASDSDSGMLYYAYSIDGGLNYSELQIWDGEDAIETTISIPYGKQIKLVCRALNGYDIEAETKIVSRNAIFKEEIAEAVSNDVAIEDKPEVVVSTEPDELYIIEKAETKPIDNMKLVLCIVGTSLLISIFFVLVLSRAMSKKKQTKRRRR